MTAAPRPAATNLGHAWIPLGATPAQIALAWLLRHSPAMLPIPGTSSRTHLEENIAAAALTLDDDDYAQLTAAGAGLRR